MNYKEEAERLVNEFCPLTANVLDYHLGIERAKKCAIKCCMKVMNHAPNVDLENPPKYFTDYLQIKMEIEKL